MNKKNIIIIVVLCAILLAGILGIVFYKTFFAENVKNREVTVLVPPGADFEQVMDTLRKYEVLKSEETFRKTAEVLKYKKIKMGKYDISDCRTNLDLVRLLRRGQHYSVKFTFNNVRTADQFVEKVGNKFFFEPSELQAMLHNSDTLKKYGLDETTSVCLFIPNTYEFYYDITASEFLDKMYGYYQQFWNEQRKATASEIGLTPVQVATLASIVEEENMRPSEKAIIAGLYMNRLHKDMLLQSDPTVKFAIGDFARKRILNADLQIDSPYNTYKYKGLPPGPIRCALPRSMDYVLNAPKTNYLYMCANPSLNGTHIFSSTFSNHANAAVEYHHMMDGKKKRK